MERTKAKQINTSSLAYIGDAVYELHIRESLIAGSTSVAAIPAGKAHKLALRYVSSEGQSTAVLAMRDSGFLTDEELAIIKRARNHKVTSHPTNADLMNYRWATGFEALIGFLYLAEDRDRLNAVCEEARRIVDGR